MSAEDAKSAAADTIVNAEATVVAAQENYSITQNILDITQAARDRARQDLELCSPVAQDDIPTTEQQQQAQPQQNDISPPKLFALFPKTGLQWRFVTINNENINRYAPQQYGRGKPYNGGQRAFHNALDFSRLRDLGITR